MVPFAPRSRKPASLVSLLALFIGLAFTAGPAFAQPQTPEYLPGEILIKFAPGASQADIAAIRSDLGATSIRTFARIGARWERITRLTVDQAITRYRGDRRVAYIEPNYVLHALETPNDPLFPQLWGMQNTGQTGGLPGADIHATQAWDVFTGSNNVLVAIIDTGMDYNHTELAPNVWTNPGEIPGNGIDDDGNGFIDDVHGYDFANGDGDPIDDHGHGTHCAGTIGAVGNNAVGVVGVNWHVTMMPVKFLNQFGSGSEAGAIASIQYATMMGVKVMSNSWGGGGFSQAMFDAIKAAGDDGIVFVAAAGNASSNNDVFPTYPATYDLPNIIAVAATDANDHLASFSNFGPTTVDLAAPGVDILSTAPGNGYQYLSGTSMATPHVSGAAALVFGRYPGIDGASVKTRLLAKVDPIASLSGVVLTGGRLNAFLPIAEADSIPPDPIQDLAVSQTNGNWIELQWTATGDDGAVGHAAHYDMRYSTAPIDAGNFDAAIPATGEPDPQTAGSAEHMRVNGLAFSTPYYFAIKAIDELGNASAISNIASGTTLGPPNVGVTPASLSADLLTGEHAIRTLTISNTGVSELRFDLSVEPVVGPGPPPTVSATFHAAQPIPAGTGRAYDAGRVPGRAPIRTAAMRAPGSPAVGGMRILLLQSGSDVSEIQSTLLSFPEITQVDIFDGNTAVPTLELLQGYNTVITVANVPYGDPFGIGNVLADYVDGGGGVVLTLATFINGWNIQGRFLTGGYLPFDLGTGPVGSSSLGAYDASHPIMQGVTALTGDLLGQVTVAAGAQLIASFVNNLPLVATKGHRVAAVNLFFGGPGFWTGDVPQMMRNAAFWAGGSPNFLALDPRTGALPPGLSVDVQVTFNAERLNGGDYNANIAIDSNDPDQSHVLVPAHLHVTGAPDITVSPTALEFGQTFITAVKPETVVVKNDGTDLLSISGVNVAPADYSVPAAGFDLNPGERHLVIVSFSPLTPTDIPGTLEIHSNDPDEGLVTVTLHGEGLVPPEISVEPSSYSVALLTGESTTRTLTIHNTGGSPLVYDIGMEFSGPGPFVTVRHADLPAGWATRHAAPGARSNKVVAAVSPSKSSRTALAPGRVLIIEDNLPWGLNSNEAVLAANAIPYDVIGSGAVASTNLVPYKLVIVASDQSSFTYSVLAGQAAKLANYVSGGGVLEFHAAGWGSQGGDASQVTLPGGMHIVQYYSSSNNVLDPAHPLMAGVPNPFFGNYASHSYFTNIPANAHLIASADAGQPDLVIYRSGAGQVIAGGQTFEFGYAYGQDPGIILNNMIPYAAALGRSWLAANPSSGSIPIGSSQDVTLTFDAAGLFGGDYHANIQVHNNDPDESLVTVPADLHVTGAPDITVSVSSLDYGQVFTGFSKPESLLVVNDGTDLLSISSMTASPADYTVPGGGFDLQPGESHRLIVTFAPQSVAVIPGTLEIHSNDPDEGLVSVSLQGEGIVPPDIGVDPTSFDVALLSNQTTTRTLTIRNTGGSNLAFKLSTRSVTPGPHLVGVADTMIMHPVTAAFRLARTTQAIVSAVAPPRSPQDRLATATPGAGSHPDPLVSAPQAHLAGNDILVLADTQIDYSLLLVLQQLGLSYDLMYTENFTGIDYSPYHTIIVGMNGGFIEQASCQALANAASDGRLLIMVGGSNYDPYYNGLQTYLLHHTGETGWVTSSTPHLRVVDPADGLAAGLPAMYTYSDFGASFYMLRIADGAATVATQNGDNHPTLVHKSVGAGTLVYFTSPASDYFWYNAPDFAILKQIMTNALTFSPAGWLTVDPAQGNLPPGGEATIQVGFNATGLFGGEYYADIRVTSNDPDEALLPVRAHLHVTGVPDITASPASIDFGQLFTGVSKSESLTIVNDGTDVLSISSISATPADYAVPGGAFDLQPRERRVLLVTFTPQSAAVIPGTLEIHSNDPDEALVTVALHGEGLVPPNIGVDPTSLSVSLLTGQQATRTITIHNTGGSNLAFTVSPRSAAAGPNAAASAGGLLRFGGGGAPMNVVAARSARTLLSALGRGTTPQGSIRTATPDAASHPVQLQTRPGAPLAGNDILVVSTTYIDYSLLLVLQQLGLSYDLIYTDDFTWIDFTPYKTILVGMDGGFVGPASCQALANAAAGGRLLIMVGGTSLDVYYQGVEAYLLHHTGETGWTIPAPPHLSVVNPGDPLANGLPPTYTFNTPPAAYYMLRIADPSAGIAAQNGDNHPALVHKAIGSGVLVYFTNSPYSGYWGDPSDFAVLKRIIQNALAYSPVPWLSVSPLAGNVPPGGDLVLQVGFDATGLSGGDYYADIQITSNDPDEALVSVPAHMHVTGAPDIAVSAPSLDFGQVFPGTSHYATVVVTNVGTDVLHVSSASVVNSAFSAPTGAFTLAPHDSLPVLVTFTPTSVGLSDGSLTFHSDDPDEADLAVALHGEAIEPPDVAVAPAAFQEVMLPDQELTEVLTVENQGAYPLSWSVDLSFPAAVTVVETLPAATSPFATETQKTVATAPPKQPGPEATLVRSGSGAPAARGAHRVDAQLAVATAPLRTALAQRPLPQVMALLDTGAYIVSSLIPDRFDFTDGETGNSIPDGGLDMFDGGNYLLTNLGGPIDYSNGVIQLSPVFGGAGAYFTRKYPGLFVMVADMDNVHNFFTAGDLGADGSGSVDGATLNADFLGSHFIGYVKRVYNAGDPSVNHLIIFEDPGSTSHGFLANTNNDYDNVDGLPPVRRIYYLLFARYNGGYVDNATMMAIMQAFLGVVNPAPTWLTASPPVGTVPPHGSANINIQFDTHGVAAGPYSASILLSSNDPDEPLVTVPVDLLVTGPTANEISLVSSATPPGMVRLQWYASNPAAITASVFRRTEASDWSEIAPISPDGTGNMVFDDREVTPGTRYGYRLGVTEANVQRFVGETWVTVPNSVSLALHGMEPNPAVADLNIAFSLPDAQPASVELLDLAGRRLLSRDVGNQGVGRHVISLGQAGTLPAGVYMIRLQRGGKVLVKKGIVMK